MDECEPLPPPPPPRRGLLSEKLSCASPARAVLWRRKLNLKAEFESIISHFSFKRLVPGGFNLGLIGSSCSGLQC